MGARQGEDGRVDCDAIFESIGKKTVCEVRVSGGRKFQDASGRRGRVVGHAGNGARGEWLVVHLKREQEGCAPRTSLDRDPFNQKSIIQCSRASFMLAMA